MRVVCVYFSAPKELEAFADSCFRFTPKISLTTNSVLLEITGCAHLYSEESLVARLQVLLKRFSLTARISIANDIPTAIALAVFQKRIRTELPIAALRVYAAPYEALARESDKATAKACTLLEHLGISTLGELLAIPRATIASRFSKEVLYGIHRIESAQSTPWKRYQPPERICEEKNIDDDYDIQILEPLLFLLRALIDRALLRLRGKGYTASSVEVTLTLEKYSHVANPVRTFVIDLAMPQSNVISLLPILSERMQRRLDKDPLIAPVRKISFTILRTAPGLGKQRDFFSKREEEIENFRAVVARLTEKLGFDRAFMASLLESYFPEKSWKKTLDEPTQEESTLPKRPLRILKEPQLIRKLDSFFLYRKRKWKVTAMHGPERLSVEWWLKEKERDYYRVETEQGEELWIFSHPETKEFFLHGIFD